MNSALKQAVQKVLFTLGYRLTKIGAQPAPVLGWDCFLSLLHRYEFNPQHIIDVGANRGNWTRAAMKYFPEAHYTLIEPQEHLKVFSQDLLHNGKKVTWISAGVSNESKSLPLSVNPRHESSTFVLSQEQALKEGLEQIVVPVMTLNEIVRASHSPFPEMVKIDAEGFDMKALSGASDLFGKTDVFLVEATICSSGHENTLQNVMTKMSDAGYRLIDIVELNRSPKYGVLWLCDVAFLRNESRLLEDAKSYND